MQYAIVNSNGITEIKSDSYPLPNGAIDLTNDQYNQLMSGKFILVNGQIVTNPNPPTL